MIIAVLSSKRLLCKVTRVPDSLSGLQLSLVRLLWLMSSMLFKAVPDHHPSKLLLPRMRLQGRVLRGRATLV